MKASRRSFFRQMSAAAGALSLSGMAAKAASFEVADGLKSLQSLDPITAAEDELSWAAVRQAYTVSPSIINLNNGGVSPQPKVVQEANDRYYHLSNEAPSYYMWGILDQGREPLREKLANLAGCSPDEIAINRNATEALDTVIYGMDLKKGDEVILTRQDYPNMINAWKQREMRDGIKLVWLNLDMPTENADYVVKAFTDAVTPKTKVFHITHMINWNGQIMPVKRLCEEAKKRNIFSLVDGAHTFAHMDFKVPDFDCDAYGTSLHKWLCAPFGTGMLYLRKDRITEIWPIFTNDNPKGDNIRKFESLGTRSFAPEQAIGQAIDFHNAIGGKRKEERLRYLKNYWCEKVKDHPKVKLNISLKPDFSCALGNFAIEGKEPGEIATRLFNDYKIHVVGIVWENIKGVRVTPHVYTLTSELDKLAAAIHKIADS
jgi:selenocysteine lyase/cysteine desulfurase